MGLDMYIFAEGPEGSDATELAYWRKHPNLHGYIVREFAGGVDECQKIPLSRADISKTLAAVKSDALPDTGGFFFGVSRPGDKLHTLPQLAGVLEYMLAHPDVRVFYQASW
jgi:hypothetical protein